MERACKENSIEEQLAKLQFCWEPPVLPEHIPQGDMPGDKISIGAEHIKKAQIIFRELCGKLPQVLEKSRAGKAVVALCGGSGVGKSEIASLLAFYFQEAGIGSYVLSGDNYPRRLPVYNDAERLRVFRESGLRAMIQEECYTEERFSVLQKLQKEEKDADRACIETYPWLSVYQKGGREGLERYLGTPEEINFSEVEHIVWQFKQGDGKIWLKRMGRDDTQLWFEQVDFSEIQLLFIEWTHGNSDFYQGVDIPVLLNSTPEETLAHRKHRSRDGKTDSAFTSLVLEIEQEELKQQAKKAKIILSKPGELWSYEQYRENMREKEEMTYGN